MRTTVEPMLYHSCHPYAPTGGAMRQIRTEPLVAREILPAIDRMPIFIRFHGSFVQRCHPQETLTPAVRVSQRLRC